MHTYTCTCTCTLYIVVFFNFDAYRRKVAKLLFTTVLARHSTQYLTVFLCISLLPFQIICIPLTLLPYQTVFLPHCLLLLNTPHSRGDLWATSELTVCLTSRHVSSSQTAFLTIEETLVYKNTQEDMYMGFWIIISHKYST